MDWKNILHPVLHNLVKDDIAQLESVLDEPAVEAAPVENIVIELYTVEQLQLQSLLESGLVDPKDHEFATSIANAPRATPSQLKWVQKLLDKLLADPPTKYEFKNLFNMLNTLVGKKYVGLFQGSPFSMKIATDSAKHPGAIYMVSEKPGLGYIGRVDVDHSVSIPRRCEEIKEELIKHLMDLNADPLKMSMKLQPAQSKTKFGAQLVTVQVKPETTAQQMARGPFDPASMQSMLSEYKDEAPWRR